MPTAPLAPEGATDLLSRTDDHVSPVRPWTVVLWNDDVNTQEFVTYTLMRVLQVDQLTAESLMLTAHLEGRAAAKSGNQAECVAVAAALGYAGVWATLERGAA